MFEDFRKRMAPARRYVAHQRTDREAGALRTAERKRRLSHIKMKRLGERRAVEEELREQTRAEIGALEKTRAVLRERKLAERELRAMQPSPLRRIGHGAGRAVLAPIRILRTGASPEGSRRLSTLVMGRPGMLAPQRRQASRPSQPQESAKDFVFGSAAKKDMDNFIFGKPGDVF